MINWNNVGEWVAGLTDDQRDRLRRSIEQIDSTSTDETILSSVRERLAEYGDDNPAVCVVFDTTEWDNGYFLTSEGFVLFADGSTDHVDFDDIDDHFTVEFGTRGASCGLAVDLRGNKLDLDDYIGNLYDQYGYPADVTHGATK